MLLSRHTRRREFIALLAGTAAYPFAAHAQQGDRLRRVGVLMHAPADEPESQARLAAFTQGLQEAGWSVGRNVRIDTRWSVGDVANLRKDAAELVASLPDVILAGTGGTPPVLSEATRTVPIVFAQGVDPVGGFTVASLSRPGGNVTGFLQFEYSLVGKWLELLKEVAPGVTRVGVVRESGVAGTGQWAVIAAVAPSFGVEVSALSLNDTSGIESAFSTFASEPNGGLIVAVSALSAVHRDLIVALAARHRLPTVYPYRFFVSHGGLISYGPELVAQYRRSASYVDRILKGEKPANLPVQAPTKYELAINLKGAKALGLTISSALLARADEVIE